MALRSASRIRGRGRGRYGWEDVLSFKLRGNRLSIQPSIPEDVARLRPQRFRYGQTEYRIEVLNGGGPDSVFQRLFVAFQNAGCRIRVQMEEVVNRGLGVVAFIRRFSIRSSEEGRASPVGHADVLKSTLRSIEMA